MTAPEPGTRYVSRKRKGQAVQVEGVQGRGDCALVALVFVKSGERWRTPLWLFTQTYRRDVVGPVEASAR